MSTAHIYIYKIRAVRVFNRVSGTVNFHPFNPVTAPKVCCHYTTSGLVINRRRFGPGDKVPLVRIAGVVVVVDVFPLRVFSPQRVHETGRVRLAKSKRTTRPARTQVGARYRAAGDDISYTGNDVYSRLRKCAITTAVFGSISFFQTVTACFN